MSGIKLMSSPGDFLDVETSILNCLNEAVYVENPDGRIVFCNTALERLTGYWREALLGRRTVELYASEALSFLAEGRQQWLQGVTTSPCIQAEMLRKDGLRILSELSLTTIKKHGQVTGYLTLVRDITEQWRAAEALKRQAALLELAHDSIFVRDLADRITFWNRAAEERYGWTQAEALGECPHTLLQTQFPEPLEDITAALLHAAGDPPKARWTVYQKQFPESVRETRRAL
jgi:PAS domain S-box-containing protein